MKSVLTSLLVFVLRVDISLSRIVHLAKNENENNESSRFKRIECPEDEASQRRLSATILLVLAGLGVLANLLVVLLLLASRRHTPGLGLVVHQCLVDCARAALLIPLGWSLLTCQHVSPKCSLIETAFLCLATVSAISLLTTVLNSTPIIPEDSTEDISLLLTDSSQCCLFALFMIWFASITVNLGPTFLSGGLAANSDEIYASPSCPMIQGPYRHYVLNFLWIMTILFCLLLAIYHLRKLHRDYSHSDLDALRFMSTNTLQDELTPGLLGRARREGVARVRMLTLLTASFLVFWSPLFLVTLASWGWSWEQDQSSIAHEVSLHICYSHAIVLPLLQLMLHPSLRAGLLSWVLCHEEEPCDQRGHKCGDDNIL